MRIRSLPSLAMPLRMAAGAVLLALCLGSTCSQTVMTSSFRDPTQHDVAVRYDGLKGQICAVMVWSDEKTRIDLPLLAYDLANEIQNRIIDEGQMRLKSPTVAGAVFPETGRRVSRFYLDYPDSQFQPATDVALRLGIDGLTRVIHIEIQDFATRSNESPDLFKGTATVKLRVIEIVGDSAKVAYEDAITAAFPPGSPIGLMGADNVDDAMIYRETIGMLGIEVAKRFYQRVMD